MKGDMYIIDPKSITKEQLYGTLDGTTLEWTDGIFTSLLRKILDNQKGYVFKKNNGTSFSVLFLIDNTPSHFFNFHFTESLNVGTGVYLTVTLTLIGVRTSIVSWMITSC